MSTGPESKGGAEAGPDVKPASLADIRNFSLTMLSGVSGNYSDPIRFRDFDLACVVGEVGSTAHISGQVGRMLEERSPEQARRYLHLGSGLDIEYDWRESVEPAHDADKKLDNTTGTMLHIIETVNSAMIRARLYQSE